MTQITKTQVISQIVDQKELKTTGTSLGGQLRVFSTSLLQASCGSDRFIQKSLSFICWCYVKCKKLFYSYFKSQSEEKRDNNCKWCHSSSKQNFNCCFIMTMQSSSLCQWHLLKLSELSKIIREFQKLSKWAGLNVRKLKYLFLVIIRLKPSKRWHKFNWRLEFD